MTVGNDNPSPDDAFGALAVGYRVLNLLAERIGVDPLQMLLAGHDEQAIAQAIGECAIDSVRDLIGSAE